MANEQYLRFNSHIGSQKPQNMHNRDVKCPFCDRAHLEGIIAAEYPILLLKNKYPVLEDTLQTVLVETDQCDSELSRYSPDHLHRLIRFGVEHWLGMDASGEFASVLFYKNHGPNSGGTIVHPHMQIVGLRQVDYRKNIDPEHFRGICVGRRPGVEFNISTRPRIGFFEFNIILDDLAGLDDFADFIQFATHYTLNGFNKACTSYNIFFYQLDVGRIAAKVMPRFVTSPLYVGFSIPQVSNRIESVAAEIKARYFA